MSSAAAGSSTPEVSVVVVADYAGGQEKSWRDLRRTLSALAAQDFDGAVEYILVESNELIGAVPEDLVERLPGLRIEFAPVAQAHGSSYLLKNHGVERARGPLVALLDADCIPIRGWLRCAVTTLRARPNAAVVSGMTQYQDGSRSARVLAVLSRSYLDRRGPTGARFVANNNCLFRREAYLSHPLPSRGGPFAGRLQSDALRAAGCLLAFEPEMRVTHDFEGWSMERDIRRNIGWATIRVRQIDPRTPHAWALKLGPLAAPFFYAAHVAVSWGAVLRVGRHYGLRVLEHPLAMLAAIYVHALELDGMRTALGGEDLRETEYR